MMLDNWAGKMSDGRGKDGTGGSLKPVPQSKKASQKSNKAREDSDAAIGAGLRSLYQSIVKEPLPEEMLALLEQLDASDHGKH